jgi:predicted nucleotidyltransferase
MVKRHQIQELADAIAAKYPVEKIILFGSYADGAATQDSDVDLLVVMDYEGRQIDVAAKLRLAANFDDPVDIVIFRTDELPERYRQLNPIAREAVDKGIILYDRRAVRVA